MEHTWKRRASGVAARRGHDVRSSSYRKLFAKSLLGRERNSRWAWSSRVEWVCSFCELRTHGGSFARAPRNASGLLVNLLVEPFSKSFAGVICVQATEHVTQRAHGQLVHRQARRGRVGAGACRRWFLFCFFFACLFGSRIWRRAPPTTTLASVLVEN